MKITIEYSEHKKHTFVIEANTSFIIENMRNLEVRFTLKIPSMNIRWDKLCSVTWVGFDENPESDTFSYRDCHFNSTAYKHDLKFSFDVRLNILKNCYGYKRAELIKL